MAQPLTGRKALVTGGTRGIGRAIAERLAADGADVTVTGTRPGGTPPAGAAYLACDFLDAAATAAFADTVAARSFDILVNNAGIAQKRGPMLDISEADFDRIYAVNVKSIYLAAVHAVPQMRAQGGGVILNTASTAGVRPRPGLTWYNGSKGAVITLTKSMAGELAADKIRVCAINPVLGATGLTADFMGGDSPDLRAQFNTTIPLGRMSTPRDVANAALFLASDEAQYITGVLLPVDGGISSRIG